MARDKGSSRAGTMKFPENLRTKREFSEPSGDLYLNKRAFCQDAKFMYVGAAVSSCHERGRQTEIGVTIITSTSISFQRGNKSNYINNIKPILFVW